MGEGGGAIVNTSRLRIKGHWQSVTRFFFIAVGFMMTWVLISSELGYYAEWFGPQILLQLNFAFYLPSIPILLVSGQLEKLLDSRLGPIGSMMIRLNVGLAGSAVICAAFPFVTRTHSALLWIVAVLGTLSAIAFSTSYQLVQWFRHADIIGLGIGGVGSGPMVLLIQLGLVYVEAWPHRWQWIAMFEVTAACVLLGLLSSISLFGQYWDVLNGTVPYEDVNQPLLGEGADAADEEEALGSPERRASADYDSPPRREIRPWYSTKVELLTQEEQSQEQDIALRFTPATNVLLNPDPFQGGMPFLLRPTGSLDLSSTPWTLPPSTLPRSRSSAAEARVRGSLDSDDQRHPALPGRPGTPIEPSLPSADPVSTKSPEDSDASRPGAAPSAPLTLAEETLLTIYHTWPVLVAFMISVSVLYLIFPMFTYIPAGSLFGDSLPRVLFFTRIGSDIVGRFAPRIKGLVTRSSSVLFGLAIIKLLVAGLLIAYLKTPDSFHHDLIPTAIVVFLWVAGGYLNTCANILAPALVPDHLVARASALMALIFQVAHFAGLVFAALVVFFMFGDIAG